MKVAVIADLHLGHTKLETIQELFAHLKQEIKPDILVIAGDIAESLSEFKIVLKEVATLGIPFGVIAGNHDLWPNEGISSENLFEKELPKAVKKYGGIWLEKENLIKDGIAIAGSIGWYDYSDRSPVTKYWNDEQFIRFKKEINHGDNRIDWKYTDVEFAEKVGMGLVKRLDALENDSNVKQVIVVTHTALVEEQNEIRNGDHPVNRSYFANVALGKQVLRFNKVTELVCGHTHRGVEATPLRQTGDCVKARVVPSEYYYPRISLIDVDAVIPLRQLNEM